MVKVKDATRKDGGLYIVHFVVCFWHVVVSANHLKMPRIVGIV